MEEAVWPHRCVLATIPHATVFCGQIHSLAVEYNTAVIVM